MTLTELELAIRDTFRKTYKAEYVGRLKIEELREGGYKLTLGMHTPEKPLIIAAQLNAIDFLKFFEKELLDRNLDLTSYYTGYQIIKDHNCDEKQDKRE